ncbi:MAG: alcohol dehydrogenase catalytic domain-containing protein [Thaumarchaeota archaeon]|nr:alcohol dehydrogenase catalytic domain-containing protein [Nitrososphaerota archaeon]
MRVAVYYSNQDIRIEEVEVPKIGAGELLIRTEACGICGTDILEWYRKKRAPVVLGHEATGVVVEVGEGVTAYKPGDRVFVSHHVPCGVCRYCLSGKETACETLHTTNYYPGGFSQYIRVPKINVEKGTYLLPDSVSFDEGVFIEPLGCVIRGQRVAGLKKDDTFLILGSGVAGLLHLQLARLKGVSKIIATDISEKKLEHAKRLGADLTINARKEDVEQALLRFNGRKADKVVLCTGAPSAYEDAIRCVDRGGTVLFFAVPDPSYRPYIPLTEYWRNEVTLTTSYGAAPRDLEEALKIVSSRALELGCLISHRLPLAETALGFRLVVEGESLKVVINPNR